VIVRKTGWDIFSERLLGGRRFFMTYLWGNWGVGPCCDGPTKRGPEPAEGNAEGASVPRRYVIEKTRPGSTESKKRRPNLLVVTRHTPFGVNKYSLEYCNGLYFTGLVRAKWYLQIRRRIQI